MTETILLAIQAVSYVVIVIILAVMANTIAMTARERAGEYATMKAIGFGPRHIATLIFGESLAIALIGGGLGIALTFPLAQAFVNAMGTLFPIFYVSDATVVLQAGATLLIGVVAACVPAWTAAHVRVVDGLRAIG
jgi:putative ABC transport system permease protein